ncbi:MAG: hypothetical protein NHB32_06790 [Fischerella sp. CENA71]|nr:hypothetical protein [Fischerella sp. CENA71]
MVKKHNIGRIAQINLMILSFASTIFFMPAQAQINKSSQVLQASRVGQAKPSLKPTSLLKMTCRSATAGVQQPLISRSKEITIGREVVKEVAVLGGDVMNFDSTIAVTCKLEPNLKNLTLEFGLDSISSFTTEKTQLLLSIYLDNNLVGEKQVIRGSKQLWSIDLKNAKNISLEAKCVQSSGVSNSCPGISFTDLTLK